MLCLVFFFFFKQKTAYEIGVRLVGSEMCIRDRPFSSPAYQFCTVEYLIVASSSATSSTTAACSWFSSRFGAVHPSRYETWLPSSATISVRSNCPVFAALIRKYVDSSIGQRTPLGM